MVISIGQNRSAVFCIVERIQWQLETLNAGFLYPHISQTPVLLVCAKFMLEPRRCQILSLLINLMPKSLK
jgi:hypothetical protein